MHPLKASSIPAGSETDLFIHLRVFKRNDQLAPPYTTNERTAAWLADRYGISTIPHEGSISSHSSVPTGYTAVRYADPAVMPMGLEPLAFGETRALAIARGVLVIEGLAEERYEVLDP